VAVPEVLPGVCTALASRLFRAVPLFHTHPFIDLVLDDLLQTFKQEFSANALAQAK
jgi:hypothetical protein